MENLATILRNYFASNSSEKILNDWRQSQKFDEFSPALDEYLALAKNKNDINSSFALPEMQTQFKLENFSPKYFSGFFSWLCVDLCA